MSIGVPIKVLHEAEGHIITCETVDGEVYRGKLIEAEDNMNVQITHVHVTFRDGRVAQMENCYVRGSKVRFIILPDMLRNAPMFKSKATMAGASGRGKSGMIRSSVGRGRGRGGPPMGRGGPPMGRGGPSSGGSWGQRR